MRKKRTTFADIKANANSAATKADNFMDWLMAQAEQVDEILDKPEELGEYIWEIAKGVVKAAKEDSKETDTKKINNEEIMQLALKIIGKLL